MAWYVEEDAKRLAEKIFIKQYNGEENEEFINLAIKCRTIAISFYLYWENQEEDVRKKNS